MRLDKWIAAALALGAAAVVSCGSPTPPSGADAANSSPGDASETPRPDAGVDPRTDAASIQSQDAAEPAPTDAAETSTPDAAEAGPDAVGLPRPDASSPGLDAAERPDAEPAGLDAATAAGPDASAPGADAAEAGPDAAAPGLDASQPDAGPTCVPACPSGEACLETTCVSVSFDALCSLGRATVLTDGQTVDDEVAAAIGQAVASECGAGFEVASAALSDPAVFDAATGRLLTPMRQLAVTAGGFYFNPLVGALEKARKSPLYFTSDGAGNIGWAASATGSPVHVFPGSDVTDSHDYFVVELFPTGDGQLVLVDYGIGVAGTRAAGIQAAAVLADTASFTDAWYVYEWSLDADAGAETVRLVASGK